MQAGASVLRETRRALGGQPETYLSLSYRCRLRFAWAGFLMFTAAAHADEPPPSPPRCATAPVMNAAIGKWGEQLAWSGLAKGSGLLTALYANEITGTWSIVVTTTEKLSCIVAVGSGSNNAAGEAS